MRDFLLGLALLIGLCPESNAQDSTLVNGRKFPEAALVLTTGAILKGSLQLYPEAEVVAITCTNDSTYTLPARLVQGFAVKDPLLSQLPRRDTYLSAERVFRSLPLGPSDRPRHADWGFYEQLSQGPGPVVLLRREQTLPVNAVIPGNRSAGSLLNPFPPRLIITKQVSYVYQTTLYLRTAAGALVRLAKPKDLLKYLPRQAPLLRAYVQENGLRYANIRDLSFLVNYANTLPQPTP